MLADRILQLTDTVADRDMREQLQAVRVAWRGHHLNLIAA